MATSKEMMKMFAKLMSEQQEQTAAAVATAVANATATADTAAAANPKRMVNSQGRADTFFFPRKKIG